ncbi:hypothetical protein LLQ46_22795 [Rouxiella badensis]|uniref:hypothetical protein n=1 Tax=Rouxiella badensis TaxID=1646377 RepID=UPI001B4C3FD7|nr:hypothetical protein [Rouxiella badensis]MCC3749690.1 hypothetical protein [Rouxiella badensis]
MKKIIIALMALIVIGASSSPAFSRGGYYAHGQGSSHKGGSYRNARTSNHYEKRH